MQKKISLIIISIISVVFLLRLYYLQMTSLGNDSILIGDEIARINQEPERGYIYDRNHKLMVYNEPSYDLLITPNKLKPFDTLEVCKLLNIKRQEIKKAYEDAKKYSWIRPSSLVTQISFKEFSYINEKIHKYKGFSILKRLRRAYKQKTAANIIGFVSKTNNSDLNSLSYYNLGDYIGKQGIEKQYEKELRGIKGVKYFQKDRFNRVIGSLKKGVYDTLAVKGKDIELTIDSDLQKYAESLMVNKRGGIIAIEPATGEILASVSSPTYDPSLLVGRKRSKNYSRLYRDSIAKPLYDRGLLAMYPPGSTFKPLNALIALQEKVVSSRTKFECNKGVKYGVSAFMGCHCSLNTKNNLLTAIYKSCNTYFLRVYLKLLNKYSSLEEGIDNWTNHVKSFGLGNYLGTDIPIGKPGNIPTSNIYNRYYKKGRWRASFTASNAIGQGEILATPIQLANMTAAIANRGFYYRPHFVKKINNIHLQDKRYTTKIKTTIDPKHFELVINGMYKVYTKGTAQRLNIKGIKIAGKTGTAENFVKIEGKRVQLTDHSIFVAFAPIKNPKIAIAVFVENGYWGSRYSGPIASLCIEKYIKKHIERKDLENLMYSKSLQEEYDKPYSGKPFEINEEIW